MTEKEENPLEAALAAHPFFAGFDPKFVHAVAQEAKAQQFDTDAILAREGTVAEVFLIVLEGKVALEVGAADNPHLTVQTVGPGEVLGWSWLVPPHRWRFDARALKPTRAIALDGAVLRRTLATHPKWGYHFLVRFMPVLAERLENTRVQLLDLHAR
jgi:CRP/FNR family transcriptional regulator, cyclic AMP receptor protein